jgi:hypothetical protein
MTPALAKKVEEFNRLKFDKLRAKTQKVKRDENGVILLDRNNPLHREWYEEDEE